MMFLSLLYCRQKVFIWIWFILHATTFGSWDPSSSTDDTHKITKKENFKSVKVIALDSFSLQAWISWKLKPSIPTSLVHRPQAPPCQICTSPPATSRVPDKSSLNSPLTMIGGAAMFASIAKNLSSSSWTGGGTSWWKSCWCWCCPQPARSWRWRWSYWSTIIQSCEGYIGDTYWWFIPYKLNIFRN